MPDPNDRRYTTTHQWACPNPDGSLTVGITDFAQSQLGDVVFVELPQVGKTVSADESCAVVESVKSASDVYAPVAGTIIEINEALPNMTESINTAPYASWFFKLHPDSAQAYQRLMSVAQYQSFIEQEN
ncbi:MAG: glycine cleavage system protein GcvH [Betaproteobacteria bacterium]|nr:glycine cleavage system protein GcvH [Betaproteobacteria bacterium]